MMKMFETRKVVAVAALIVATGVAGIEMSRSPAQAAMPAGNAVDYARSRIDSAFVAAAPVQAKTIRIAAAAKSDRLAGTARAFGDTVTVRAETLGNTTVLTRTGEVNVAQF